MARSAKFHVWESKLRKGRFFYTLASTIPVTKPAPNTFYPTLKAVLAQVQDEWLSFGKALGVYGKHTTATFLATHPIPFTPQSLKPAAAKQTETKVTTDSKMHAKPARLLKKAKKIARKIQRIAAVDKIVEGAQIGSTSLPQPMTATRAPMASKARRKNQPQETVTA